MYNINLTDWIQNANISIENIIEILRANKKPMSSMEVFKKLKEVDTSIEQKFAQFSKLFCTILVREKVIKIIEGEKHLYILEED